MATDIVIGMAGSGGDGIVSAGDSLVSAAAHEGFHAVMTKSFGPQIRGGESSCRVRRSGQRLHSPGSSLDIAVALNWDDFLKFGGVSSPVLTQAAEGDQLYRMLMLKSRTSPHKAHLVDDYQKLQAQTIIEKQNKIMEEWVQKKVKTTYINISDDYKTCDNLRYWNKTDK